MPDQGPRTGPGAGSAASGRTASGKASKGKVPRRKAGPGKATKAGGGGRVTPKATGRATPPATGRYTPPIPKEQKVSPRWVPVLMFTLLVLGVLVVVLNYMNGLPGEASNTYLLLGLGLIAAGFLTATRYR